MNHSSVCSSDFAFQSARCSYADEQEDQQLLPQHDASATGLEANPPDAMVTLCVGGTDFATTNSTLTAAPGSYLAALFSGRWTPSVFVPGTRTPFIDRDPASFKYVLSYLRSLKQPNSQIILPETPVELKQLRAEADFYGLPGLTQACMLGRFCSALNTSEQSQADAPLLQQSGMFREPTFGTMQKFPSSSDNNNSSGSQAWNSFVSSGTGQRNPACRPSAAAAAVGGSSRSSDAGAAISGEDVQLLVNPQQPEHRVPCLARCVHTAQQLLSAQKQSWTNQPQWQQLGDLILRHLLHLPLAAQQADLVSALASPEEGAQLQFSLQYYPVGDLRIELECKLVPAGYHSCTPQAAGPPAPAAGAADAPSPQLSPRDGSCSSRPPASSILASRTPSGSLLPSLAAARARPASPNLQDEPNMAAAAATPSASSSGATPGPGWGGVVTYHRFSIRETPDKFILTTHMPGEGAAIEEHARLAYRPELNEYSTLHKLLVQQCPRSSVAGLVWMLEEAGFAAVKLSTTLETYSVNSNSFPGYKSLLTFEL